MRDITENHYKNNAKNFMDKISDKNNKGISTEVRDFLACLLENQPDDRGMLNPMTQWDWNKVSFMVDSGASETVANDEEFPEFELVETTASGTEYSSACNGGPVITNMGEKVIEVMDANGDMAFMKVQMCRDLNKKKLLASVSRITQAGHMVSFRPPTMGSFIQNVKSGKKIWLRQEGGVYYLDLWINKAQTFGRPGTPM